MSSDVATSISCRDITLCHCRFQLVAHDVATSISCRDITLRNYKLQLVALGVATSISYRDITLWLCRFHLMVPDVATSAPGTANFNWARLMSRHQSLVATSTYVFGGFTGCFWCRDFSPLSRQHLESHRFHFFKPVTALRRFSCRDLHPLSRHQPLSRHHDVVATSFIKSLFNHQLPNL